MAASGAYVFAAVAGSPATEGDTGSGIERLTTAASRISLVDVIGTGCLSTDGIVQADDAMAIISNGNTRSKFASKRSKG